MPHYVGIAGVTNDDGFPESRVSSCCVPATGHVSAGGMLIPIAAISIRRVLDGTSKTIIVGETSNFAIDSMGKTRHLDGGYPNGWMTGTTASGTPPNYNSSFSPPCWNITTIRYSVGTRTYPSAGVLENRRGQEKHEGNYVYKLDKYDVTTAQYTQGDTFCQGVGANEMEKPPRKETVGSRCVARFGANFTASAAAVN
jgi:hypothetical protein